MGRATGCTIIGARTSKWYRAGGCKTPVASPECICGIKGDETIRTGHALGIAIAKKTELKGKEGGIKELIVQGGAGKR